MAERALVTGGAGFIGSRLASALLGRGAEVTLLDDFSRGRADAELREIAQHAEVIEHDLCEPIALKGGFDTVYHLAAIVGVRRASTDPDAVLRTNLLTTINVLDWCAQTGVRTVFMSSTSEIADGAASLGMATFPVPESATACFPDVTSPRTSYAVSKLAGEMLLASYARRHGFAARSARYHNVYGPRMGYDHVIPQLIERVLDRRDPFPVYGAYQSRAFCYVDDAVAATLALVDLQSPDALVVNLGNDREEIKIVDLLDRLFDLTGFSAELEIHPPPDGSPERRLPSLDGLRALTGYEPAVDLDAGLRTTWAWYRDRQLAGARATA